MQILFFFIVQCVLFFFYIVFGMTLFPQALRRAENKNALFLVAPLLGVCVWFTLTVGIGVLLPYNAVYLGCAFAAAAVWILYRRKTLFLPDYSDVWILLAVLILFSMLLADDIAPRKIDGGFYFSPSVYDHVKCAILNSISRHGLPPVNPWLADGGKPLALVYYFGWHAWAAQLPILTNCNAFFAECAMTGFTFAAALSGLAGLTGFCDDKKGRFGIIFLVLLVGFDIGYTDVAEMVVPKSWMSFLSTPKLSGFWNLYDDFIWAPQHMLAASAVILILGFFFALLKSENAKTSAAYAALLGLLATTAVFTSVYSGVFALIAVAVLMLFDYAHKREFRRDFNRILPWLGAAVFLCFALSAAYLKFLFSYPPENAPLAVGMMPCFGEIRFWWQYPLCFLQFYFLVLPMRLGIIYVFGMIAVFVPGVLPVHPLVNFCKKYVVATFLVIFFIHSTFYSNDFGWRLLSTSNLLLAVFAVFTLHRLYHGIVRCVKKRGIAIAVCTPFVAVFLVVSFFDYSVYRESLRYEPSLHKGFARAVPGWKVVQAHTGKDDLVLCNPAGFYKLGKLAASSESTNVFFSLYAERDTPIADLIFAKCYSEFFPQKKLEERYEKVVAIFAGAPSKSDADYLADDLKTRALLVTPFDGLWENPGAIGSRFPMKEETADFRVYWREDR